MAIPVLSRLLPHAFLEFHLRLKRYEQELPKRRLPIVDEVGDLQHGRVAKLNGRLSFRALFRPGDGGQRQGSSVSTNHRLQLHAAVCVGLGNQGGKATIACLAGTKRKDGPLGHLADSRVFSFLLADLLQ